MGEKAAVLRERDAALASMEAEINELFSKLNMLQSEKGKFQEREQLIRYNTKSGKTADQVEQLIW